VAFTVVCNAVVTFVNEGAGYGGLRVSEEK
jgi:hypothetical protein